jgi:hypothetical protein
VKSRLYIYIYNIYIYIYEADANAATKELADAAHVCGRIRRMRTYAETEVRSRSRRRDASV